MQAETENTVVVVCDYCGAQVTSTVSCDKCGQTIDQPSAEKKADRIRAEVKDLVMPAWWKAFTWVLLASGVLYLIALVFEAMVVAGMRDEFEVWVETLTNDDALANFDSDVSRLMPGMILAAALSVGVLVAFIVWHFTTRYLVAEAIGDGSRMVMWHWTVAAMLTMFIASCVLGVGMNIDPYRIDSFPDLREALSTYYTGLYIQVFADVLFGVFLVARVWVLGRRLGLTANAQSKVAR